MKKNLIYLLIDITLIFILVFIFIYSNDIKESVLIAINIWNNSLIPSIFPFLLLSNLLVKYGFIEIISKIFGRATEIIYNLPKSASYAIITSMFTGFPTGSKYIKDLLQNREIDNEDANVLITFTSFSNPLFVISAVGEGMLHNKKIGIKIFMVHLFTGLFVGLLFKKKKERKNIQVNKKVINNKSFIENLINSINETFKILANILGLLIFFFIIVTIINKILPNNLITLLLKGLIEITTGINYIAKSKIQIKMKAALIGLLLSFNGLSIHFQTKSIIENTDIKYENYLISRTIHALLCFIILLFF